VSPDLRMAGHAGVRRREAGTGLGHHRGVAIAAVKAEFADMVRVTERNRLGRSYPNACGIGRIGQASNQDEEDRHPADNRKDGEAQHGIGARGEKLAHA
jgi:hypothetical protein